MAIFLVWSAKIVFGRADETKPHFDWRGRFGGQDSYASCGEGVGFGGIEFRKFGCYSCGDSGEGGVCSGGCHGDSGGGGALSLNCGIFVFCMLFKP